MITPVVVVMPSTRRSLTRWLSWSRRRLLLAAFLTEHLAGSDGLEVDRVRLVRG
jgi:hypothetical protein